MKNQELSLTPKTQICLAQIEKIQGLLTRDTKEDKNFKLEEIIEEGKKNDIDTIMGAIFKNIELAIKKIYSENLDTEYYSVLSVTLTRLKKNYTFCMISINNNQAVGDFIDEELLPFINQLQLKTRGQTH